MDTENDSSLDDQVSKRILEKYEKLISSEGLRKSLGEPPIASSTESVEYLPASAGDAMHPLGATTTGNFDFRENHQPSPHTETGRRSRLESPTAKISEMEENGDFADFNDSHIDDDVNGGTAELAQSTMARIQEDNEQLLNTVRERAQQQILELNRERDTLLQESRESIAQLQNELAQTRRRFDRLKTEHTRALTDMEELRRVYDTREAGMQDKLILLEKENQHLKEDARGMHEEMRAFEDAQQNSFNERVKVVQESQRQAVAQLAQRVKLTQSRLEQTEEDKLLLLKQAAADMCKLNDCIESQRDKISQLKTQGKELKSELMIIQHERDMGAEQNHSAQTEIDSLRRRNENLTRELLRVDKMIYGRSRK